jgi:hypothetical protein
MSFKLITEVWQLKLTPTQQQVLLAMADYADDDGRNCFPSQPRLAWKTGLSKSTIVRTIDQLIAMGILKVIRLATNKAPARYEIWLDMGEMKPPYLNDNEDFRDVTMLSQGASRGSTVTPLDSLGCHGDTSGGSTVNSRGSMVTPDPIINQSYNPPVNENGPLRPLGAGKTPEQTAAETAQKWAQVVAELATEHRTMGAWLQGSELIATGAMQDGKPLYRLLVVNPSSVDWLRHQAGRAICAGVRGVLGRPVAVDVVGELAAVRP